MMAWVSVLWMVVVLWPGRVESVLTYFLSGSMTPVRKHREFLAVNYPTTSVMGSVNIRD